ncbi:protein kinase domain-containing protein [Baaleninema sp.]|uniref:protein kinase domain-containing protein n=1 Tax=Baaleninema sp. TaxID=3101197 RepID=UPI003D07C8D0
MTNTCPSCLHENLPGERVCIVCGTSLTPTIQSVSSTPGSAIATPSVSSLHLPSGTLLKKGIYKVIKTIGQGGFGITYEAVYCKNNARVAIKELWPENGYRQGNSVLWPSSISPIDRNEQIQKFKLEAANLQRCNSPNIAQIYDCFEENSTIYMVMEFIDGSTLLNILESKKQIPETKVINYIKQIAEALENVHQNQLLHRDIKLENIIIDRSDRAVLIDFGTAREFIAGKTADMTVFLSPGYAPFEQYSKTAKRLKSSDIYALCAATYELLTGQLPSASVDRATAISNGSPDPLIPPRKLNPNLSPHLERVVLMGLRFRAEERIQNARDLIAALDGKLVSPLHQKARNFISQNNLTEAVNTYETCLEREPDNTEIAIELALTLLHLYRQNPSDHLLDRAEAAARNALGTPDGRSYGVCGFINCQRQQWKTAVKQLQQGLHLSPNQAWMHTNLAWAFGNLNDWNAAHSSIQTALQLNLNDTFALGVQAWIAFHRQQWKTVVRAGTQAIFKSQQDSPQMATDLKSWVYPFTIAALERVTTQKGSDVARRVRAFVTQVPDNAVALGLQAWYEYRQSNLAACRQSLELANCCNRVPDWVAINGGLIYEHLDDWASAARFYEERHLQNPQDAWINARLGTVLGILGQWNSAKPYLEKAVKQNPQLPQAYRNLGWVLSQLRTVDGKVESVRELLAAYRQAVALCETQHPEAAKEIRTLFQGIGISL